MPNLQGIVLRAHSGRYAVLDEHGTLECRARRRLHRPEDSWPEFAVPGDEVEWRLLGGSGAHRDGIIEAVRPRRTEISRSRFGSKHVVVANLDRLVVVAAVRDPTLDRGLLDRLLATAEFNGIPAIIVFNKVDLAEDDALRSLQAAYEKAGYPVVLASAKTGAGIDALREHLRGHTSALMGSSGAGKSRIIGMLQPGLKIRTGDVSDKTGQGRHTTSRVDLHRTDFGALLADTPGLRDFAIWQLEIDAVRGLFPEIRALDGTCRFNTCVHRHEPDCAVQRAVEDGGIDSSRYHSYLAIVAHIEAERTGTDREGRRRRRETSEA